jgi:hypothetical protein
MYDMAFHKHRSFALINVFNSTQNRYVELLELKGLLMTPNDYSVFITSTVCYTDEHRWLIFATELQYMDSLAQ